MAFRFGSGIMVAMTGTDARDQDEQHRFFRGAAVIASLTMLSRIFGLVREAAIGAMGATYTMGAFRVAFRIPNLFRRLFGEGAVSSAFVPVFTEVDQGDGPRAAREVLANAAGLLAVLLGTIVIVGELAMLAWLLIATPDGQQTLLLKLTMIVLPFMFTVCLLAVGAAALNCRKHFAYPAFAPILLNVFMIAAALLAHACFDGGSEGGLVLLAGSVTVAGVVQLVGVIWLLKRMGLAARPTIRPVLQPVRRIAALTLPMLLPMSILQLSAFFDGLYLYAIAERPGTTTLDVFGLHLARPVGEGVVTWFDCANRLYQYPMAILGISLATAIFPLFSRYAAKNDVDGLRQTANRAIRWSLFMGIPSGVAMFFLATPAVAVIFRHGNFTSFDVTRTAFILRMYCLGMWAYFCNHILLRAFFSQKDVRTPLWTACILAGVNLAMVVTLVFTPLAEGAVGLATAITASINALTLTVILRRRWGRLGLRSILASLGRIILAAGAMGATLAGICHLMFGQVDGTSNTRAAVALLVAIPTAAGVFLVVARLLRAPELTELRDSLRKRQPDN